MAPNELSWNDIKYPSRRDDPDKSVYTWIEGKKMDDGAGELWRIYNSLYDFTEFINKHPGGSMWLQLTKGTDITESFESHHLTNKPEQLLSKFYVAEAKTPRNSPFSFHKNGFYKTMKAKVLKYFDGKSPPITKTSRFFLDLYFYSGLIFSMLAAKYESITLATVAGICFGFVINCGHNFVHMRDTWRIYYYHFTAFSVREWRISHCLSHHQYPNTLNDLELSLFEPAFQFLPNADKSWLARFGSWIYAPVICALVSVGQLLKRIRNRVFMKEDFLLFAPPILMLSLGKPQLFTIFLWIYILSVDGFVFTVIGFTAAHHSYKAFHEGDVPREDRDWGLHQVDTTHERKEITGNVYLGLIVYGEHTLHHLFPTIDHVHLAKLLPLYYETLEEFGVELNEKSYISLIGETFLQLARNVKNIEKRKQKKNQ